MAWSNYLEWRARYFKLEDTLSDGAYSMSIEKLEEATASAYSHYGLWILNPDESNSGFKTVHATLYRALAVRRVCLWLGLTI